MFKIKHTKYFPSLFQVQNLLNSALWHLFEGEQWRISPWWGICVSYWLGIGGGCPQNFAHHLYGRIKDNTVLCESSPCTDGKLSANKSWQCLILTESMVIVTENLFSLMDSKMPSFPLYPPFNTITFLPEIKVGKELHNRLPNFC